MALNWIDVKDFSFHSLLLLERFQIRLLCGIEDPSFQASLPLSPGILPTAARNARIP